MSVNLAQLIGRKDYLIPIKSSELFDEVLKQLNIGDNWEIITKRPKSARFRLNHKEKYAYFKLGDEGKPTTELNLTLKRNEFDNNPLKCYNWTQERLVNYVPVELNYIIVEERVDGCIVNTFCKPAMYNKIVRDLEYTLSDSQDVKIRCEEFLDEIFMGGLGGKEIEEVKKVGSWKLLINDTKTRQITEKVYEMLKDATTCVLLMGWVGTDCLPKFKELKNVGITVKAVTHKPSELKSPVPTDIQKGYTELIDIIGLENVSINPLLHGRALIVDNKALIGSMDFNSHSLSGEHVEFAIYTEDVDIVRGLRNHFEGMFKPLKQ